MRMFALALTLPVAITSLARAETAVDPDANKQQLLELKAGLKNGTWRGKTSSPGRRPCSITIKWQEEDGNPVLNVHATAKTAKAFNYVYTARVTDVLEFRLPDSDGDPRRYYEISLTPQLKEEKPLRFDFISQQDDGALSTLVVDVRVLENGLYKPLGNHFGCFKTKARGQ